MIMKQTVFRFAGIVVIADRFRGGKLVMPPTDTHIVLVSEYFPGGKAARA
jgi:hypothetical protein